MSNGIINSAGQNIIKMKTLEGEIRIFDKSKINDVEEVLVLRQHSSKPHHEETFKRFMPGEKYKVAGLQKAEAIMSGLVSLDLNAKLPVTKKRTIEDAAQSKIKNDFNKEGFIGLQKQINDLTALVEKLSAGKK